MSLVCLKMIKYKTMLFSKQNNAGSQKRWLQDDLGNIWLHFFIVTLGSLLNRKILLLYCLKEPENKNLLSRYMHLFFTIINAFYYTPLHLLWFLISAAPTFPFIVVFKLSHPKPAVSMQGPSESVASISSIWPNGPEYNNFWIRIPV